MSKANTEAELAAAQAAWASAREAERLNPSPETRDASQAVPVRHGMTTQEERQRAHDREERLEEARQQAARAYRDARRRGSRRGRPEFVVHARNCTCLFCKTTR